MQPKFVWTRELEDEICEVIAKTPKCMEHIVNAHPAWPCIDLIRSRAAYNAEFGHRYHDAKARQVNAWAEEAMRIADEGARDKIIDENGKSKPDFEYVARSRLKVDTIKWYASKLAPKLYGDRITQDTTITIKHEDAIEDLK